MAPCPRVTRYAKTHCLNSVPLPVLCRLWLFCFCGEFSCKTRCRRDYDHRGTSYDHRGTSYDHRGTSYDHRGTNYDHRGTNYDHDVSHEGRC